MYFQEVILALQEFWGRLPERQQPGVPSACPRSLAALAVTREEVKAITNRVSLVIGEKDPVRGMYVVPLEPVRPDWPVTVIAGAGHINCIFKREFREALELKLAQAR